MRTTVVRVRPRSSYGFLCDHNWLVEVFVAEIRSASVRIPAVARFTFGVWSVLTPQQQEVARAEAKEVGAKIEVVP